MQGLTHVLQAYGFRNWETPGAFAEYASRSHGDKGRFEGFLACLWSAAFCIVGPEYISIVAAEAKRPSVYIKAAFKTVYWRFGIFFIMGALCVGIVIPYNDPKLVNIYFGNGEKGTAASSPYVMAMTNMGIKILPDIVNALMLTSIFSAGNTYTVSLAPVALVNKYDADSRQYAATRNLYGLSLEGRAPRFLSYTLKNGVPLFSFLIVMCFPCLSFLSLGSGANKVLTWLVSLITAGGIIDYIVMCITYIFFWRAIKAQNINRDNFPYKGWFQPYSAWIGLVWLTIIVLCYGYESFSPFSVDNFFINYTMVIAAPVLYFGWKIIHKTKIIKPHECDLTWDRPVIDAYEASFMNPPIGFWTEIAQMFGFRRHIKDEQKV